MLMKNRHSEDFNYPTACINPLVPKSFGNMRRGICHVGKQNASFCTQVQTQWMFLPAKITTF